MQRLKNIAAATLAVLTLGAMSAGAQTSQQKARQNDKNLMRNLGLGLGAGAIHEAIKGRKTNAIVLGAGAALAGKKYEDARKAQSKENKTYRSYRYKDGRRVGYYVMRGNSKVRYVSYR